MAHQIAIFGDSYVRRLRDFCHWHMKVPGEVYWYGRGGLRSDRMDYNLQDRLLRKRPTAAVIVLEGNDINPTSSPREIFERLCSIADDVYQVGTKHVYITEIVTRGNFSKCPGRSKESFDRQRKRINKLLAKTFQQYFISVPDIKYPKDYSYDGVHLNGSGMYKFECRLRRILFALKH